MADTPGPKPYKPTLFDRHGADAALYIKASAWGIMVFGLTAGAIISQRGLSIASLFIGLTAGAVAGALASFDGIRRYRLPMKDAPAARGIVKG